MGQKIWGINPLNQSLSKINKTRHNLYESHSSKSSSLRETHSQEGQVDI